jgi:TolB-like protein/DNA-binding winged helix-turn-helix (wHTH) protein
MALEQAAAQELVLDLTSFQLIRGRQRVKLEKTPMELLTLLVSKRGALVTREEIVHAIWGDAVHVDVDAGINTAIRKIRHALEDDSASPRYLETVVGKGYRFIGPITVVGGTVPEAARFRPKATGPSREVKAALVVGAGLAAVLLLAIAAVVHRDTSALSGAPQGRVVIAVVPLQNLSENPGEDYFVDGLTDEILTQLGQLNPERLGVMRYGSSAGAPHIKPASADLSKPSGAQYSLEGSVRRQGEQARISIRLLRTADQATIWTESFDRNVGDALSLQSEIAQRVGNELQVQVLGRNSPKPARPDVVEAYLRGRFEMSRHTAPDAARVYFERAIALDASYAPAHAGLADFYRSRAIGDDEGSEQAWVLAERYATQALAQDPDYPEAHAAMAQIKLMHDWDWHAAREHALRALQLNPSSPEAHAVYARYLRIAGNMGEALNQRKQAVALDPLRVDLRAQLTLEYFFARDYQNGVASARSLLADDPQFGHGALCVDLGYLKLFDESVAECKKALPLDGHADWVPGYVREYHERGYEAAMSFIAKQDLKEIQKRPQPDLWGLANAYVSAGMPDNALRTLFKAVKIHEPGLLQVRDDPDFDPIRSDPRYAELVRQIGFPTE